MKEFLEFIRFEISVFSSLAGVLGFLIFNQLDIQIVLVALCAFCVISSGRAYNNLRDKREDVINRQTLNLYTSNISGRIVILLLFFSGLLLTLLLPLISTIFYLTVMVVIIIYSDFRIKRYFMAKNFISGIYLSLTFLMGVGFINADVLTYCLTAFLFIYTSSLVSDIRDHDGDKEAGLRTVPVILGLNNTKKIIYVLYLIFSILVFYMSLTEYIIFSLFVPIIIVSMIMKNETYAHRLGGLSIILTIIFILF